MTNIICYEGLDRAGKTTAINSMFSLLKRHGVQSVEKISSLGPFDVEQLGRKFLRTNMLDTVREYKTEVLYNYFLMVTYYKLGLIKDAIERNVEYLLVDRTHLSGYIYNGIQFQHLLYNITNYPLDKVATTLVFMDIGPDVSYSRTLEEENRKLEDYSEMSHIEALYYGFNNTINGIKNLLNNNAVHAEGFNRLIETPFNPTLDYITDELPTKVLECISNDIKYYCRDDKECKIDIPE